MSKELYPVEVQVLLFRQLLAYETLLKPEYCLHISKCSSDSLFVYIIEKCTHTIAYDKIETFSPHILQTAKELDAALAKFWNEVPQKFKIQN